MLVYFPVRMTVIVWKYSYFVAYVKLIMPRYKCSYRILIFVQQEVEDFEIRAIIFTSNNF